MRVFFTSHRTLKQDKTAPISPDIAAAIDIIMARPNAAVLKNAIKVIAGSSLPLAAAVISRKLENAKISGKYNVVCANIVADVVIRLLGDVRTFMEENAVLLVSGIIDTRENDVLAAAEKHGFKVKTIGARLR